MSQRFDQCVRIMGIDPGSRRVGIALLDCEGSEVRNIEAESFTLEGKTFSERLISLGEILKSWVVAHRPQVAVVEEVFVHKSPRSALVLGMARGVALYLLAQEKVPVVGVSTTRVKRLIGGHGRVNKEGIRHLLMGEYRLPLLPFDASDALAVALAYFYENKQRSPETSPGLKGSS